MKVIEESGKYGLKLNIQKLRSWHHVPSLHGKQMGKQWKQWQTIFLWGSKITAYGDFSHEIKRCLLLGRKDMNNIDSILKSRDISLLTKVSLCKAMLFLVVMYGSECWTIKKADCWRTDAFELWCWRRLLRVPWTARRSSQSILKEIKSEYSLGGLMMKFQYFGYLNWRTVSLQETLMLGRLKAGEGDDRGWDGWMASPTQWTWVWASSGSWWRIRKPVCFSPSGCKELDTTEWLYWIELKVSDRKVERKGRAVSDKPVRKDPWGGHHGAEV